MLAGEAVQPVFQVEQLRLRLAADLHDDVGSNLSAILLLSRRVQKLGALVNELLRQALAVGTRRPPYTLDLEGWEAEAQPGVDILDRDKLFDLMNGR